MIFRLTGIIPAGLWLFVAVCIIFAAVVSYALYSKSDVMASFSHGSTILRLEAKGRGARRRNDRGR